MKILPAVLVGFPLCAWGVDESYLIARRDELQKQINAVDSEIARCKKMQKNWKIATIVGGVGAVATGIGVLAQQSAINENKKIISQNQAQVEAYMKILKENKEELKIETEFLDGVTK
jgi:hypothetical protein